MTDWAARLAEDDARIAAAAQEGTIDWAARLAEDDARKAKAQAAFTEKRAAKNPLSRTLGDLYRGGTQGIRDTVYAAGDLVGDAAQGAGLVTPEQRKGHPIIQQKTEREPVFPHYSNSLTERSARMGGQIMSVPGLGPGKTLATTVAKAAGTGGLESLLMSDSDTLGGKAADTAVGATAAGGLGALFHSVVRGLSGKSPEYLRLDQYIQENLGDTRLSGDLPLAQMVGDSKDLGSKLTSKIAAKGNKGGRAGVALDRSQRMMDDIFRVTAKQAFKKVPSAWDEFEAIFSKTRSANQAFKAAKKEVTRVSKTGIVDPAKLAEFEALEAAFHPTMLGKSSAAAQKVRGARKIARDKTEAVKAINRKANRDRIDSGWTPTAQELDDVKTAQATALRQRQAGPGGWNERVADIAKEGRSEVNALRRSLSAELGAAKKAAKPTRPTVNRAKEDDLGALIKSVDASKHGRYSPQDAKLAGHRGLGQMMTPMANFGEAGQTGLQKVPDVGMYWASLPASLLLGGSGNTTAAAAAALPFAVKELQRHSTKAANRQFKRQIKKSGQGSHFIPDVRDLPDIDNKTLSMAKDVLTGDTAAQRKLQELLERGDMKASQDFLFKLAAKKQGAPEQDSE